MYSGISSQPVQRPDSAVSTGIGIAGLLGLALWLAIARIQGWDGPYAAMIGVFATGLPMVLWALCVDKVHRRASTGIDWTDAKPVRDILTISLTKLAGLLATWGMIAVLYCLCRWYWTGNYGFSMQMLGFAAPVLFLISVPYVIWLDRYLVNPRDGAWHFGAMLLGRESADREQVYNHMRSWAVKGFFLAFMISIVPGGFGEIVRLDIRQVLQNPVLTAQWLIVAMFVVDVQFATIGYMLTMKPLDAHIRTANPYMAGWVAALICYPPFILMDVGGPLYYYQNDHAWMDWFGGNMPLLALWGVVLVALTGIYAWATVAFGLRFSNLTHRGIITHGPYIFTKHPAYVSKNAFWWLATLPFLTNGSVVDMIRNTAVLAAISGVYYWRARTEEKHLMADPAYRAYAAWANTHAPVPRFVNWLFGGSRRAVAETQPAE